MARLGVIFRVHYLLISTVQLGQLGVLLCTESRWRLHLHRVLFYKLLYYGPLYRSAEDVCIIKLGINCLRASEPPFLDLDRSLTHVVGISLFEEIL